VQIVRAPQNALVAGCWRRAASCRRPRGSCPAVAACRLSGGSSASAVA
jgi:hypothetical protein